MRRTCTLHRGTRETRVCEPSNFSISIMTTVEQNLSRETLTPQLANINHLVKGKTHETALRFGAVWEALDFNIPHLAKAYYCLPRWAGAHGTSCTDSQPRSAGSKHIHTNCTWLLVNTPVPPSRDYMTLLQCLECALCYQTKEIMQR